MSRTLVNEARTAGQATPVEGKPGRFLLRLISPGWGASGYYSPEVLEAAADAGVFKAGMHCYIDHPHADGSGQDHNGNRSVRDLASVLAENARWDGESQALVAETTVFGPFREALGQMRDAIGMSIRAMAETSFGEAEGRRGTIVDELVEGISADYVTSAGRGGAIVQVLESARPVEESRNIGQWIESRIHRDFTTLADDMAGDGRLTREERISLSSAIGDALAAFVERLEGDQPQLYSRDLWDDPQDTVATAMEAAMSVTANTTRRAVRHGVAEATADERREQLADAVRDAHGSENTWAWVRDFDDSVVWFEVHAEDAASRTYEQTYDVASDDLSVALTGDPTEVRAVIKYVPTTRSDGSTTTEESEEDTMPEIAESELRTLREAAGRVQTLESELSTEREARESAETERDQLRESNARRERTATIRRIVGEAAEAAEVTLDEDQELGIAARAVIADDGSLNESATREAADKRVAAIKEAQGAGRPRGLGSSRPSDGGEQSVSESDMDALDQAVFGGLELQEG